MAEIRRLKGGKLGDGFFLQVWEGEEGDHSDWEVKALFARAQNASLRLVMSGSAQAFEPDGAPRPRQSVGDHSDLLPPFTKLGTHRIISSASYVAWCIARVRSDGTNADYDYVHAYVKAGDRVDVPHGRRAMLGGGQFLCEGIPITAPHLIHAETKDTVVEAVTDGFLLQFWPLGE